MGVVCDQSITTANQERAPAPCGLVFSLGFWAPQQPRPSTQFPSLTDGTRHSPSSSPSCTNVKEANVKYHDHFLLEQSLFKQTMSKHYIDDHMSKHSQFLGRFDKWEAPVAEHELTWAKNWLVQHIKNT